MRNEAGNKRETNKAPIITSIKRRVKPGLKDEFEKLMSEVMETTNQFPGYLGGDVLRPSANEREGKSKSETDEWQLILHFDSQENLEQWRNSPEHRGWTARADALSLGALKVKQVNGLEFWFTLPGQAEAPAPPKWKMAIISGIVIYPLILVVPRLLAPLTQELPIWLATLISILLTVPLMTWVLLPLATLLFKSWLYSSDAINQD